MCSSAHLRQSLQPELFQVCELCNLPGQFSPAQVDISQGCLNAAMSGVCRDLMDVPASAGQIGQAKMPQGVSTKLRNRGLASKLLDCFGPRPDGDWLSSVPRRRG